MVARKVIGAAACAAPVVAGWLSMASADADGQIAAAAARSAIGKPYAWGAAGPNAFDCSGLVVWSEAQAGVSVPRTSEQQAVGGIPVSRNELEPGDVITYYANASHAAVYVGDGMVVHASTYGRPVAEVPMDAAGPFHNARRYRKAGKMTDTLFADVSEWQVPVDDSYPYKVLSIRVSDGTYVDHKFAHNYAWMRRALDDGRLTFGIVYTYVRPSNWKANAQTVIQQIEANGGLHPRVCLMLDVENGGNGRYDFSDAINSIYYELADYAGNKARIIGYGNVSDLNVCWPRKPEGIRLIVAGYGGNPSYPGKVAHQYTDGQGYGGGLPEGCPPFGNCDMNSADGLSPNDFAVACGVAGKEPEVPQSNPPAIPKPGDESRQVSEVWDQLLLRWDCAGGRTLVELMSAVAAKLGIEGCRDLLGDKD